MTPILRKSSWSSYPKVWAIGHPAIEDLFEGKVIVQEKIDGSQLSFGMFEGEIKIRSKGKVFPIDAPESLFQRAADAVFQLAPLLHEGWTYRAEYLRSPSHNALSYERTPTKHIILFDVSNGYQSFLRPAGVAEEAHRLGLETVPLLFEGPVLNPETLLDLIGDSCLGNVTAEGIVVKNYARWGVDGKVLMGKFVRPEFQEINHTAQKSNNPGAQDIRETIKDKFRTEARWEKAVQYLRDQGCLLGEPKDIGALMKRVNVDVEEECAQEVKEMLWQWFRKDFLRGCVRGLPEWYKEKLFKQAFSE